MHTVETRCHHLILSSVLLRRQAPAVAIESWPSWHTSLRHELLPHHHGHLLVAASSVRWGVARKIIAAVCIAASPPLALGGLIAFLTSFFWRNLCNVVLVELVPANTGNIGRTCVVSGTHLHLIGPVGFLARRQSLKRAGMAYCRVLAFPSTITGINFWKNGLTQASGAPADAAHDAVAAASTAFQRCSTAVDHYIFWLRS